MIRALPLRDVGLEFAPTIGMLESLERLFFDLADTLFGQVIAITNLFQRQWASTIETKSVLNDFALFVG